MITRRKLRTYLLESAEKDCKFDFSTSVMNATDTIDNDMIESSVSRAVMTYKEISSKSSHRYWLLLTVYHSSDFSSRWTMRLLVIYSESCFCSVQHMTSSLIELFESMSSRDFVLKFVMQNRIITYSKNDCKISLISAWKIRYRIIAKWLNVQRVTDKSLNFNIWTDS